MNDYPEARLELLGLRLPSTVQAAADYVPCTQAGNVVYVSGQTPRLADGLLHPGTVGDDVTPEQAAEAARVCALRALAALRDHVGKLSKVVGVVKLVVYVRASPAFSALSTVADAASQVMRVAFGESGKHARTTVGVAALPGHACVEIEATFQLAGDGRLQ